MLNANQGDPPAVRREHPGKAQGLRRVFQVSRRVVVVVLAAVAVAVVVAAVLLHLISSNRTYPVSAVTDAGDAGEDTSFSFAFSHQVHKDIAIFEMFLATLFRQE